MAGIPRLVCAAGEGIVPHLRLAVHAGAFDEAVSKDLETLREGHRVVQEAVAYLRKGGRRSLCFRNNERMQGKSDPTQNMESKQGLGRE